MSNTINYHSCVKATEKFSFKFREIYDACCKFDNVSNPFFIDDDSTYSDIPILYYATDADKIISFISIYIIDDTNAEICGFTLPEYRRRGIAARLFDTLLDSYEDYILHVSIPKNNTIGKAFLKDYEFEYESTECKMELTKKAYGDKSDADTIDMDAVDIVSEVADNTLTYSILTSGDFIGSCMVYVSGDTAVIHDVEIKASHRKKGYGHALITKVLDSIFTKHSKTILHVTKENAPAYNLYLKLGFIVTEELEYYRI